MEKKALPKITAVVSFCSNDWRFLERCVRGVAPFCSQILITVCDRFFDGSKENYSLLEEAFRTFDDCTFLSFSFDSHKTYRLFSPLFPEHPDWRHEWHNTGRYLSYFYASGEYLLFLDSDEIVDAPRFEHWLSLREWRGYSAIRFAGLWHFREAAFEALKRADLCLWVEKSALHPDFLWDEDERMGLFHRMQGRKLQHAAGCDALPLIRHYSGVRTLQEFKKKLASWGHHWERDWQRLLEEEFSRPFNGVDFIRGYEYHVVEAHFDPLAVQVPSIPERTHEEYLKGLHRFPNVIMVDGKEILKRQLDDEFALFAPRCDRQFLQQ